MHDSGSRLPSKSPDPSNSGIADLDLIVRGTDQGEPQSEGDHADMYLTH